MTADLPDNQTARRKLQMTSRTMRAGGLLLSVVDAVQQ